MEIKEYRRLLLSILDSDSLEEAEKIRDELISQGKNLLEVIYKLSWDFIIPYFKNLTIYLKDSKIERTSNKLENSFLKIFNKHIKKIMKSETGIESRFALGLKYWDESNLLDS